ncbi:MAG: hypothetical protein ACXWPM_10495 [Bdellovibrionota bacterium]
MRAWGAIIIIPLLASGCGSDYANGFFHRIPNVEFFSPKSLTTTTEVIQTSITGPFDILWVVDNSGSMSAHQNDIAAGFQSFAANYLKPGTDIRLAVITTDAYLAGDTSTPVAKGFTYGDITQYARLLPGIADGPRPWTATGTPIRSGQAILSSSDPSLISDFLINVKPGTNGSGDERGMESIVKLIHDNEQLPGCQSATPDPSCFFRKGSRRAIMIVSDENDSSRFPGALSQADVVNYAKSYYDGFFRTLDGAFHRPRILRLRDREQESGSQLPAHRVPGRYGD